MLGSMVPVCITSILCLIVKEVSPTVVAIGQGMVRGHKRDGYISFEGIPYASVGAHQRFKKAGPPPTWSSIRESQQNNCSLTSAASDCLQLDIHVPKVKTLLLPVFAWVRGGSDLYNAAKLVEQGILVVIISHRFGFEGFLCSDDEKIPGNAGAKDVVMALRWVKKNIILFRGNPSHVVVGGQSFGAAMVEALTLSPMAKNLYRGIIMQSGSILCPWAFHYDAINKTIALGKSLAGKDVVSSLLTASSKTLLDKATENKLSYHSFGFCVEEKFKNEQQFLSDSPYNILSNGRMEVINDIPILIGYNNDEANVFLPALQSKRVQETINLNPLVLMPEELHIATSSQDDQKRTLVQLLRLYFERNDTLSITSLLAYHRDAYFLNHIYRSVRLHNAVLLSPVYFYQYSYSKKRDFQTSGAGHSDEISYLFPEKNYTFTGPEAFVQKNLIELWSNFIKFLNPTPDRSIGIWEPMDPGNPMVYDISHKLKMKAFPHTLQMQFWDELYGKLYYENRS